ncbi:MAG TPA: 4'-phosphopantetheinyl transferase superfamily protein [Solirubrobacterales bacterium]|nr:4'-phosphopantetheinyl transferase superfamily protein [Solirubrobacterales bacterium]
MEFLPAPDRLDPPLGEVHVWQLKPESAQEPSSKAALRQVLARYLEEGPGEIELTAGEHGKPRLAGEQLHFNLSHSEALALIAICGNREVGVDVERIKPGRDLIALAERALLPADAAAIKEAPEAEREATFYRRWACHEARLKCLGSGIGSLPPPNSPPVVVETLTVDPEYAAAVAVTGTELPPLRGWTFDSPHPENG